MPTFSHSLTRLSMLVLAGLGYVAAAGPAHAGKAGGSPYFGRWTVAEDTPVFTARGRPYKTVDIVPCGRDFCGVSVGDKGKCGVALFRFRGGRADGGAALRGRGKWGDVQKNVEIFALDDSAGAGGRSFQFLLGDGHDLFSRSGNMPRFHATYRRLGGARCSAG